jgi:uncharacterized protein (TIGR03435 family)
MIRLVPAFVWVWAVFGQTAFEVASIRPNVGGDDRSVFSRTSLSRSPEGVKLEVRNASLKLCLQRAFDVRAHQISGPDWLSTTRFDIAARAPVAVTMEEARIMWQALLEDRFKLKLHRETRVLPVYTLVVGKNGPKIRAAEGEGQSGTWEGKGQLTAKKESMARFADALSRRMDRPVVDETGLSGAYDFVLDLLRDESHGDPGPNYDGAIFTALQDQLGLKLEAKKQPVEILVIDHAEKLPTEN